MGMSSGWAKGTRYGKEDRQCSRQVRQYHHDDETGGKKGESRPGLFGETICYDDKYRKTAVIQPGLLDTDKICNAEGHRIGRWDATALAGYNQDDSDGYRIRHTDPAWLSISRDR